MRPINFALFAAMLFLTQPAQAHHSVAMFDRSISFTLDGTVKDFQWTNPHSWLTLEVIENGTPVEYNLETQSPNILARKGWKSSSVRVGDKVTVVAHPLKNGRSGGQLVSVKMADGSVLEAY